MDSLARIRPSLSNLLLPVLAVFADDLRQSSRHWALWVWLLLGLAAPWCGFATISSSGASPSSRPVRELDRLQDLGASQRPTAASFSGDLLRLHLFGFTLLAIVLAATAIPGESEVAAGAILCRGISRWQYYTGKCASRVLVVVAAGTGLAAISLAVAAVRFPNDVLGGGVLIVLVSFGALMTSVAAVCVAGSIWFRQSMMAAAVLWMLVYGLGIVAVVLELPAMSPALLADQFADVLRGALTCPASSLPSVAAGFALLATAIGLASFSRLDI